MNVYISSHDKQKATDLAVVLADAGHAVVSTWHNPVAQWPDPAQDDARGWARIAKRNLGQIAEADALILIANDGPSPGGKFAEAGMAYSMGTDVFVIGRLENRLMIGIATAVFATEQELLKGIK